MAVKKDEKSKVTIESPKPQKYKLFLPKERGRHAENYMFVGINGKNYQIKRGEEVEVPYEVYETVMNSLAAQEEAESYIDANEKND